MRALLLLPLLLAAPALAQPLPPVGQGLAAASLPGAALLRPQVVVEEAAIRLSDLFEGAGPRAAAVIGSAPGPGRRIVLDTAQLAAIARTYGVAWRPLADERAVIERPGRPLQREEITDVLRPDLLLQGMEAEAELEMPGFVAPQVPPGAMLQLTAEQAAFDPATRRFAATLVIAADGLPVQRMRLAGRAVSTVPMVVATHRMALGEVLGPGDVRVVRVPAGRLRPGAAQALDQVLGQQLRRPASAEMPVALADLGAPVVIEKNGLVTMQVEAPGLTLATQGKALEPGGRGQVISVINLASRSVVEAEVLGPGRVRVAFGTAPLREQSLSPTAAIAARNAR
jgi:flagella basal body P-ring formation protein FlgA